MAHLPLSCGEAGGEPGRVLGSHVTHVLHTAGMQKQANKQTKKTATIAESIAEIP